LSLLLFCELGRGPRQLVNHIIIVSTFFHTFIPPFPNTHTHTHTHTCAHPLPSSALLLFISSVFLCLTGQLTHVIFSFSISLPAFPPTLSNTHSLTHSHTHTHTHTHTLTLSHTHT